MFKIHYYNVSSSLDSKEVFQTEQDAVAYLKAGGFKLNRNKNVYERRVGRFYQEATILSI